jgi:hypothetical protein
LIHETPLRLGRKNKPPSGQLGDGVKNQGSDLPVFSVVFWAWWWILGQVDNNLVFHTNFNDEITLWL